MRIFRNTPLQLGPKAANSRRFGRVRCERLRCAFVGVDIPEAAVLDISASGVRVSSGRNPGVAAGQAARILLSTQEARFEVVARVVWNKRRGYRRYELGLTFGELTEEQRRSVTALMRAGVDPHIIYTGEAC